MFKREKKQKEARKGNNRWADDEDDIPNPNSTNNSNKNHTVPSFIKKPNYSNSNATFNQPNNNNNYQPSSNRPQKDTRFALEKKLIDDILQPTGIKVKPDEKLMVDFCRRAKNLDRTLIYSYLMEKLSPYKSYIGNTEKINTLIKCLYLISYIIDSKIEDLFEVFSDNQQIFIDIKSTLGNNRKISELTEQILQFLGVESNQGNESNDYQNFESGKDNDKILQNNDSNINKTNTNLLDFGDQNNNNNGNNNTGNINLLEDIFQNDGNNNNINQQSNNKGNDLLGDIFGNNNQNPINNNQSNNNNNNIFPMDIFGVPSQNPNQNNQNSFFDNINTQNISQNQNNNQTHNQSKGFNFIKKSDSSNINNGNETKPQAKKGFSFIKQTNNSNNITNLNQITNENKLMTNDLNNIFNNNSQPSSQQQNMNNDINFNNNSNQLENIFNMQSTNNSQENKIPTLIAQKPEFNINQVYQNTTSLQQGMKANDPFNFVDDLFKKK